MKSGLAIAIVIAIFACTLLASALPATAQVQHTRDYLSKMDGNDDGKVSLAEYQDWMSYAFDAMDRDRDGMLAPAEQPGGRGKSVSRVEHQARLAERFRKQDLNHDGFLSARELAAPPQ